MITYFNKRKDEIEALKQAGDDGKGHLQSLFESAKAKPLASFKGETVFSSPPPGKSKKVAAKDSERSITFKVDQKRADAVKKSLDVNSWTKVGEEVFNYYYNAECGDE